MPALSLALLGFALGAGLCWSTVRELSRPVRPLGGQALLVAAALGLTAFAPAVALILVVEPDWALGYWISMESLPGALPALWPLWCGLLVPLGFALSRRAARARAAAFSPIWLWVPLLAALAISLPFASRLSIQASFAQYRGDYALRPVVGGAFGYLLAWLLASLVAAAFFARRTLSYLAKGGAEVR
jgi:hypothetical protein